MTVGVEKWDREGERINKEQRVQGVLRGLMAQDDGVAAKAAVALASTAVIAGAGGDSPWGSSPARWWQPLVDALAADGLEFDPEREQLTPSAAEISMVDERSRLEKILEERGWDDAANHYRQCAEGVATSNWESANGQGRSFLEDLIPRVARELGGSKAPGKPRPAIQFLRDKGLLLEGEFDFARGLWEMCNSRGAHPGRSDGEEARFRLVAVSAYARLLMSRLD